MSPDFPWGPFCLTAPSQGILSKSWVLEPGGVQISMLLVFDWIFICGSLRVFLPHDEDSHASSFQGLVSDTSVDALQGSSSQPVSRNPFQGSCFLPSVFLSGCGHLTLKVGG